MRSQSFHSTWSGISCFRFDIEYSRSPAAAYRRGWKQVYSTHLTSCYNEVPLCWGNHHFSLIDIYIYVFYINNIFSYLEIQFLYKKGYFEFVDFHSQVTVIWCNLYLSLSIRCGIQKWLVERWLMISVSIFDNAVIIEFVKSANIIFNW